MKDRKEPTISSYSPSKEDLARDNQRGARAAARGPAPSSQPVVVKSSLAPVAMVFALAAAAAAGFLYWQLLSAQNSLALADQRIADLESKFELSDDESSASTETMLAKLKWADSEIRKLWGVAYDTNRKAIAANKSAIEQVKTASTGANKATEKKLADLAAELRLANDLLDAQQTSLTSIEQGNARIQSQSTEINNKMRSIEQSDREMERRVRSNEQAIEAIDAFRRNVNQEILQLKGGA